MRSRATSPYDVFNLVRMRRERARRTPSGATSASVWITLRSNPMVADDASLRAVVGSWHGAVSGAAVADFARQLEAVSTVHTELSSTVFSGEASDWVRYLNTPVEARYERGLAVRVHLQPDLCLVAFEAE